jgi:uncharacterized protein
VTMYSLGEFHRFQGAGQEFLYLVPSGGIVAVDGMTSDILQRLEHTPLSHEDLVAGLCGEVTPQARWRSALTSCAR